MATLGNQLIDTYKIDVKGNTYNGLTYTPTLVSGKKYPLILHFHGAGEPGTTIADLQKIVSTSIPYRIANGFKPMASDGTEFIVCSPQSPFTPMGELGIPFMLNDIISRYPVDTDRIYATGYSYGGYAVLECLTDDINLAKRFAAFVPVSTAAIEPVANLGYATIPRGANLITNIVSLKKPVWFISGDNRDFGNGNSALYVKEINAAGANPAAIWTIYGQTHWATNAYDPAQKPVESGGLNIYDWLNQYSLAAIAIPPPVVIPPLPAKVVLFSINLTDGKKFTLYTDGSYLLA